MVKFGRKFFFDSKHSKKRKIITYIVIGLIALLVLFLLFKLIGLVSKKKIVNKPKTDVVVRKEVTTEVYAPLPDKTVYFEELANFKIEDIRVTYPSNLPLEANLDDCSEDSKKIIAEINDGSELTEKQEEAKACIKYYPTTIGIYDVIVSFNNKEYTVSLNVADNTAPILKVKNLEIIEGTTYDIKDFVESCEDNSKQDCDFKYNYKNEDDENIDYGAYTKADTYNISIIAIDKSGNRSEPQEVILTIKEKPEIKTYTVKFDSNGGSKVSDQVVTENSKVKTPITPTRAGYTFAGWYKGKDQYNFNNPVTSDFTLVANWKKISSGNGGGSGSGNGGGTSTPVCQYGDLSYDNNKYPVIAVYASNGNCAISQSNINSVTYGNKAKLMVNNEISKLRKWEAGTSYSGLEIGMYGNGPQGVPNLSNKGYVGYVIEFSIAQKINGRYVEVARYYLDQNSKRHFSLNTINLPER